MRAVSNNRWIHETLTGAVFFNGHKNEAKFNWMQEMKEIFRVNRYKNFVKGQLAVTQVLGRTCDKRVQKAVCQLVHQSVKV
jgi:hypothetical protein